MAYIHTHIVYENYVINYLFLKQTDLLLKISFTLESYDHLK